MTSAFVELTNCTALYLDPKSCTNIWLEDGIGPKRSTATASQFFVGTLLNQQLCSLFFFTNILQLMHVLTQLITFDCKQGIRSVTVVVFPLIWLLLGWLPLRGNAIAFCCSFSGSMILSDFSKVVFPVIVMATLMCSLDSLLL